MSDKVALPDVIDLTRSVVVAYVRNNRIPVSELPAMIKSVHGTLVGLDG
ncbi:MAG TPA: MucR family transcriptional regulator [Rhizomicrobium sp.]|jgi:predicted transcriptional regulator